jgi:hypothetical protein
MFVDRDLILWSIKKFAALGPFGRVCLISPFGAKIHAFPPRAEAAVDPKRFSHETKVRRFEGYGEKSVC